MSAESAVGPPRNLPPRRRVVIREIKRLTPRTRCLRLHGPTLKGFEIGAPGAHVKLILPGPGSEVVPEPVGYEGRRAIFAEGAITPFLRTYTPLRYDSTQCSLDIEIVLHDDSPVADWLQRARVGHEIIVAGPRGGWNPPQDGDWYLVAADETGIPAAAQVLRALPDQPVSVFFAVRHSTELRSLQGVDDSRPQWRYAGPSADRPGHVLEEAVRSFPLPAGKGYVWVALESGAMQRIRDYLLHTAGMPADRMVTRGYWKLGVADHPDGDYGQY